MPELRKCFEFEHPNWQLTNNDRLGQQAGRLPAVAFVASFFCGALPVAQGSCVDVFHIRKAGD